MSRLYGYARVSTAEQDLSIQTEALRRAGCETIREEKRSGATRQGRDELDTLLAFLRAGDTLVVTRIDRLARSIGDLQDIVRSLKAKGVSLRATEQPIDTSTAAGKAFLDMLGVFAEFETNLRRERQLEGIAQAKARGVYAGRKPSIDRSKVLELDAAGLGATEIADKLQIGRASVYRILDAQRENALMMKDEDVFSAMGLKVSNQEPSTQNELSRTVERLHRNRLDETKNAYESYVAVQREFDPDYDPSSDPKCQAYTDKIDELTTRLGERAAPSSVQANELETTGRNTVKSSNDHPVRELSEEELHHMRMELDGE